MTSRKGITPPPDWTAAEDARLVELLEAKRPWGEIAAAIGRSIGACTARRYALRSARRRNRANRDRAPGIAWPARKEAEATALAMRAAALTAPRSLTAEIFGDPLPGRSALDRRADAAGRRITLPGMEA